MRAGIRWTGGSLLFLAGAAIGLYLQRTAPLVVLVNETGRHLSGVRLVTFDSAGEHTGGAEELAPGGQVAVEVRTSDLYLREVSFTLEGRPVNHRRGGIACWGETLILRVSPDGGIQESYGLSKW
jgi:hypothetical protein